MGNQGAVWFPGKRVALALFGFAWLGAAFGPAVAVPAAPAYAAVPQVPTVVKVPLPELSNAQRCVDLPGCCNCRQLGGLPARAGFVRRNFIYRTDGLSQLEAPQVSRIEELGWRVVVDLRNPTERKDQGVDKLPRRPWYFLWLPLCRNVLLPMGDIDLPQDPVSPYVSMLKHNRASIAGFFEVLAQESNYPLAFHCYAGKDRTGIMTALILELLGTPRPLIFADFLYSRHNGVYYVDAADLQACFDYVDTEYGGRVERYLTEAGAEPNSLKKIPQLLVDNRP